MNKFFRMFVFLIASLFAFSVSADEMSDLKDAMKDLQDRIDDLEDSAEDSGAAGWWTKTSVGGYGELHYNNSNGSGKLTFTDMFYSSIINSMILLALILSLSLSTVLLVAATQLKKKVKLS